MKKKCTWFSRCIFVFDIGLTLTLRVQGINMIPCKFASLGPTNLFYAPVRIFMRQTGFERPKERGGRVDGFCGTEMDFDFVDGGGVRGISHQGRHHFYSEPRSDS